MILLLALAALMGASKIRAQEPSKPKTESSVAVDPSITGQQFAALPELEHHFWDKKNDWLFVSVGAARTFDYFSTLNLRRRGDKEVLLTNAIVDNHAAFAAI